MSAVRGGRAVVDLLRAEGVRYIFGIVGATFLDVLDALDDDRSVAYVNVKHFFGGRYIGCDIGNPRYDELARLFGAAGYYVDHPDQVPVAAVRHR